MKVKCTTDEWSFFTLDKEYEVISKEDWGYVVYADDGGEVILSGHECEVIEEAAQESTQELTVEPTREFKVGDKVKIVKKSIFNGFGDWVPEMDDTIGCHGVVIDINQKAVAVKLVIGGYWWYPAESIGLIEEAKQDEIKEEPVQCNEAFEDRSGCLTHVIAPPRVNKDITYQQFLNAFDDDGASVEINKASIEIAYGIVTFTCTTHEREQEVMKALIVLFGKREGENK